MADDWEYGPDDEVEVITTAPGVLDDKGVVPVGSKRTIPARLFSARWMRLVEDEVVQPLDQADDLTEIKGIGEVVVGKLSSIGITSFEQIASWGPEDIRGIDEQLDLKGAITRQDWQGQAKTLME